MPTARVGPRPSKGADDFSRTRVSLLLPTPSAPGPQRGRQTQAGPDTGRRPGRGDDLLPSAMAQLLVTPRRQQRNRQSATPGFWAELGHGADATSTRRPAADARATDGTKGRPARPDHPATSCSRAGAAPTLTPTSPPSTGGRATWSRPCPPDGARASDCRRGFVGWLMGLDDGWVTGVPDCRAHSSFKMLGSGVVPQQTELALQLLLGQPTDHPAACPATCCPPRSSTTWATARPPMGRLVRR